MIDAKDMEKYSSAMTLSDMELFLFPELMYSLVLADIMSPLIWQWRQVDCFEKLKGKTSYRKLMRLRQYIMDEFDFNLDLETWGLTRKEREIARFKDIISPEDIARSNALFGYEGDKYYFDVDIRKHFGLDKYDSEVIPYWKTETVEAMNAFRRKPGYDRAAGECVSLASLYASAIFIVGGVPLSDIYMVLTPLHSQNFIDLDDGILTNNRRLVTKTMWFNGTEISNKAQRALRHERVTIVAHSTGYVHCIFDDATMDKQAYRYFTEKLAAYLDAGLDMAVFASFVRGHAEYQKFFQFCRDCRGQAQFLKAEVLFQYEHGSSYKISDTTHEKLLAEVNDEDFVPYEIPGRIRCDRLDEVIRKKRINLTKADDRDPLRLFLEPVVPNAKRFVEELADFTHVEARLPSPNKRFLASDPIELSPDQTRDEIIDTLQQKRKTNVTADLAFYAYRDMETCDWRPFVKAAVERSPVSAAMTKSQTTDEIHAWLMQMDNESIYDAKRLAQPDEVANYRCGDGIEKAFVMANILRQRNPEQSVHLLVEKDRAVLKSGKDYVYGSAKGLEGEVIVRSDGTIEVSR